MTKEAGTKYTHPDWWLDLEVLGDPDAEYCNVRVHRKGDLAEFAIKSYVTTFPGFVVKAVTRDAKKVKE